MLLIKRAGMFYCYSYALIQVLQLINLDRPIIRSFTANEPKAGSEVDFEIEEDSGSEDIRIDDHDAMNYLDRVDLLSRVVNQPSRVDVTEQAGLVTLQITEVEHEPERVNLENYRRLLLDSEAFERFLFAIRSRNTLSGTDTTVREVLRGQILKAIDSASKEFRKTTEGYLKPRISRWRRPNTYNLSLELDWDPIAFLRNEGYDGQPSQILGNIITLTGDEEASQALSCQEYMEQIWPYTGLKTLDNLCQALDTMGKTDTHGKFNDYYLPVSKAC